MKSYRMLSLATLSLAVLGSCARAAIHVYDGISRTIDKIVLYHLADEVVEVRRDLPQGVMPVQLAPTARVLRVVRDQRSLIEQFTLPSNTFAY